MNRAMARCIVALLGTAFLVAGLAASPAMAAKKHKHAHGKSISIKQKGGNGGAGGNGGSAGPVACVVGPCNSVAGNGGNGGNGGSGTGGNGGSNTAAGSNSDANLNSFNGV